MRTVVHLILAMRPRQWAKNLLIFLALIFSINLYWDLAHPGEFLALLSDSIVAFIVFCLLSGSEYLINDILDLESDRQHPRKALRPIASGKLSVATAASVAAILAIGSIAAGFVLSFWFGAICLLYFVLMLLYSSVLKRQVIIDALVVAVGFVIRALAGAVVIGVPISPWLYICTLLGALFISFAKRRQELVLLNGNGQAHRSTLGHYTVPFLDATISMTATASVVAYSLYTFTAGNLPDNHAMMFTVPFVVYGVLRYMYLVHTRNMGGSPEDILLGDKPMLLDVALWLVTSAAILFFTR